MCWWKLIHPKVFSELANSKTRKYLLQSMPCQLFFLCDRIRVHAFIMYRYARERFYLLAYSSTDSQKTQSQVMSYQSMLQSPSLKESMDLLQHRRLLGLMQPLLENVNGECKRRLGKILKTSEKEKGEGKSNRKSNRKSNASNISTFHVCNKCNDCITATIMQE